MPQISPFRLMMMLFIGLGASGAYGVVGLALVSFFAGKEDAQLFFAAYTSSFKTILSFGLILGVAPIVYKYQTVIPLTIEAAFTEAQLSATDYYNYKQKFFSTFRSITFSAEFIVVAFVIFSYARFPLSKPGEILMMIASCAEYGLGVYVGRKLMYASMVVGYYEGPFRYDSIVGHSVKPFLLVPVIVGTPVLLIFNFYPRTVLRKLYGQSIDFEARKLKKAMANASLSLYEKRSYLMEFNRMSREELRYSLQLTLSDLPIGITILIMALQSLMRR